MTLEAIAVGAAPVLSGATLVFAVDDAEAPAPSSLGCRPDGELADAWRAFTTTRAPRLGGGIVGGVGATAAPRHGQGSQARSCSDPRRDARPRARLADRRPDHGGSGRMQGVPATADRADNR